VTFSHNDFYHPFLLRQVPPNCRRALDVGCGRGVFARLLAGLAEHVDAVDRSTEMISVAQTHPLPNVRYINADVRELDLTGYDFISCIAAIHHLPFAETVALLRNALNPGGVLAIIGLSRPTFADLALSAVAFWPNRVRMIAGRRGVPNGPKPPVMDPELSLPEIRAHAQKVLPGAKIRRHLYWRYSLVYRR
jgi:SAM-dependent methyltransferase